MVNAHLEEPWSSQATGADCQSWQCTMSGLEGGQGGGAAVSGAWRTCVSLLPGLAWCVGERREAAWQGGSAVKVGGGWRAGAWRWAVRVGL